MANVILINPFSKTVSEVNLDLNSFDAIYDILKCEMVDYVPFGDGDELLVDDGGLFVNPDEQTYFTFASESLGRIMLAGRSLVVSVTKTEVWTSPASTTSDILARTAWAEHSEGAAYAAQFR